MSRRSIEAYQVGWVCALPKELTAARAMLDEEHEDCYTQAPQDTNSYVLGRVDKHNVVIACLPTGVYGTVSAATVANNMVRTFTGIRFGVMVGIGGGIPDLEKGWDIRLGDVVVSHPDGIHGGVVQYDLGKNQGEGKFELKGFLQPPPTILLTALANLRSRHSSHGHQILRTLSDTFMRLPRLIESGYDCPGAKRDLLYCSCAHNHLKSTTSSLCQNGIVARQPRKDTSPEIHYGVIASGNEVIKNALKRDRLGHEFGAKCVEMEAAGLMNDFPCLIIRGICDYADASKNDVWQEYAALTAAAFAKELLCVVKPMETAKVEHVTEVTKFNLGLNLFDAPDMGKDLFVGRQSDIREMEKILQPRSTSTGLNREILIIGGMGGIGKTQLSIEYAKKHRSSYSSIFWLNANSEITVITSLRAIAQRIMPDTTTRRLDEEVLRGLVSNWLSEQGNTRWLLIFDNFDDPDKYKIKAYFPAAAQGSIIITTRQPRALNGNQLKVGSMKRVEDSLQILATRSQRGHVESDLDARKLAERLDGHPLALATTAAFLRDSSITFAEYLQQYNTQWTALSAIEELPEYPARTLFSTWNLSLDRIRRESRDAAELLKFFAYLDNRDIWYELLSGGISDLNHPRWFRDTFANRLAFEKTLRVLIKYCLVEISHEPGSYSLHVCVHDWTLHELNREVDMTLYLLGGDCLSYHVLDADWGNFHSAKYSRYTPHAARLAHVNFINNVDCRLLPPISVFAFIHVARLLAKTGQWTAAELLHRLLLNSGEQEFGPNQSIVLVIVLALGTLYHDQQELCKSKQMCQLALSVLERAAGPDHSITLMCVNNLGASCFRTGEQEKAEQLWQRALRGKENTFGPDHPRTLLTVSNLGNLYLEQGNLDKAEQMYQRALIGMEKVLGPDHLSVLDTIYNLGKLYQRRGELDKCKQMYRRALSSSEEALGLVHISTLDSICGLASVYRDEGKLNKAVEMYRRAMSGFEQGGHLASISALHNMHDLGLLYEEQVLLDEAEDWLQRAVNGKKAILAVDDGSTIDSVNALSRVRLKKERKGSRCPATIPLQFRETQL